MNAKAKRGVQTASCSLFLKAAVFPPGRPALRPQVISIPQTAGAHAPRPVNAFVARLHLMFFFFLLCSYSHYVLAVSLPCPPPLCSSSLCLAHMQGWLNVGVWEMSHLVAHLILACPYLGCPEIHFSCRRCCCGGERGGTMQRHYGELFSTFLFPLCTFFYFFF